MPLFFRFATVERINYSTSPRACFGTGGKIGGYENATLRALSLASSRVGGVCQLETRQVARAKCFAALSQTYGMQQMPLVTLHALR